MSELIIKKQPKTFEEYDRERIATATRLKGLEHFNPENDIVISKRELELYNQFKMLTALSLKIESIYSEQKTISSKVAELHAVQTGDLYKTPEIKKLTPKQKKQAEADAEMAYLQSLRANAHRKILNGLD